MLVPRRAKAPAFKDLCRARRLFIGIRRGPTDAKLHRLPDLPNWFPSGYFPSAQ